MAEFILKDWYGKDQTYDKETIYVQGTDGELMPFTHGTGNPVIQPLEITENGTYEAPAGVDGYSPVTVDIDPTVQGLLPYGEVGGFALDSYFHAYTPGFVSPAPFILESGKAYRVKWDGEVFDDCVAYTIPAEEAITAIGNGSSLGLQGNDEPFLILHNATNDNIQIFSTEEEASHFVGIWEKIVPEESEEMIYYRSLAESLMMRDAKYMGSETKMEMKGFVLSDGTTLGTLPQYSFAGFKKIEGMSFSDVLLINENAFFECTALKIIDITVPKEYPYSGMFSGAFNGCPNLEAVIYRASEGGLETASVPISHGGGDSFYIYVPSAYYDAVTANLEGAVLQKERYRKLEDYPLVDRWNEACTVSWYDSDGHTLLKSEKYLPGDVPLFVPEKDRYIFTGWTPEPVAVSGDAKYVANWEAMVTFADATWEQIDEICSAGNHASRFSIGDSKPVKLTYADGTSETINFTIIGMNVDVKATDGSTAALTLMADNILKTSLQPASGSRTGNPHFYRMDNAKTFFANIRAAFPVELQEVITPVYKTRVGTTMFDDLCDVFIASKLNLDGVEYSNSSTSLGDFASTNRTISPNAQYPYFKNGATVKRTKLLDAAEDVYWTSTLTRNNYSSYYQVCFFAYDGTTSAGNNMYPHSLSYGIVPCICIG